MSTADVQQTASNPSLGAPIPRPDLNGWLIQQKDDRRVYLIDTGYKRHISHPSTLADLFILNPEIHLFEDVRQITTGNEIQPDVVLVKAKGTSKVYLIDVVPLGEKDTLFKRHVSNMKQYQFDDGKVKELPTIVVDAIPTGPELPPRPKS